MNIIWWVIIIIIVIILLIIGIKLIFQYRELEVPIDCRSLEIIKRIKLEPEGSKLISFNPSITKYEDKYLVIYRINLISGLMTKKYKIGMTILDKDFNIERNTSFLEIPNRYMFVNGYMDPRVFTHNDQVYALVIVYHSVDINILPIPRMHLIKLNIVSRTIESDQTIIPFHEGIDTIQKNWNYLDITHAHNPIFVARINPMTIVSLDMDNAIPKTLFSTHCQLMDDKLIGKNTYKKINGGTKAIRVNNKFVAIGHTKITRSGNMDFIFASFFYEFNTSAPYAVTRFSNEFSIPTGRFKKDKSEKIQMITGLEIHNNEEVIITLGINDRFMLGVTCSKNTIENILNENVV